MLTFCITIEQRSRAQERAAALDLARSDPPGRHPFVWDNRLNSVIRWYDYGAPTNKLGIISFQSAPCSDREDSGQTEAITCTTELFHRPLPPSEDPRQTKITDPNEHWTLFTLFWHELLGEDITSDGRPGTDP
ncbi:MAG: hypothetical protein A3A44_03490 [Candidatus Sungbacteria bacterium RIFCSPLOWO2_01_FULL_60_25]|uniref:Uncharacterized protein n=1 Tax=Candidatus Sungbacteria bacterium RIFCSPLOWO2_01_FULL_60_25 TaxID=1802281 RepID=A0A1G2LCK7_9BACT|nr:MAG: hypothetical protein A3A44_03490 [Candidatus Sungbacteria bacterium RIFCSPLOWO2_01_FULL_60_25]